MIVVEEKLPKHPDTRILERFDDGTGKNIHPVLDRVRATALKDFKRLGIPAGKNERYRYTAVGKLLDRPFVPLLHPHHRNFKVEEIFRCDIPTLDTLEFTVLNGFFFEEQETLMELPGGVLVGGLRQALKQVPQLAEAYLDNLSNTVNDGLVALNRAMATDGFFMYVPDGMVMDKPVQLVNLVKDDEDIMVQHRSLVILGKDAQAALLICDHALSEQKFISHGLMEVFVGENSAMEITKLQNEHNSMTDLSSLFIRQERNSRVRTNTISLHGGLIRNNLHVILQGEGAENQAYGLFLMDRKQHVDNSVFVDHAAPHCFSNQLYKGVLDDEATGAFDGKILVRPHAQKTEAFQVNKNILLTDHAKMNTKPQLEIYADDVKCTHGATVGQLDEEALFYLRSRGIHEYEARMLLMYAFAHEVIREIKIDPLQDRIHELVDKRLHGELPRCHTCLVDYHK
ncbi:MAG: Fe-S cluster assembly protein SufD [Bacteroidales bacterium]|nr:Fe-S cluster assembly protein SufD [Bacteroidales bacterium]